MKKFFTLSICTALVLSIATVDALRSIAAPKKTPQSTLKKSDFSKTMRKLWNDHIVWTREYIISATSDSSFTPFATKRLLKNQEDIGNAIKPFYGTTAGKQLTALLKKHITLAVDLINAAKKKDTKTFKELDKKWHLNADEISKFLSKANPYIHFNEMREEMYSHLKFTTNSASHRLNKKWDADVKNYDAARNQIDHMADMLAKSIFRAFPERFVKKKAHKQAE